MLATKNLPRLLAHERKSRGHQGRSILSGNCLLFLGSQETRGEEDVKKGNGQDTYGQEALSGQVTGQLNERRNVAR